jgi:hypothetical protein
VSYILDALRKSEQERQRGTPLGLQAVHVSVWNRPGRKNLWPWMLAIALLANAGLLLGWLAPWKGKKADPETVLSQTTAAPSSDKTSPAVGESVSVQETPASRPGGKQQPAAGGVQSGASSQTAEAARAKESSRPGATPNRKVDERSSGLAGRPSTAPPVSPTVKSGQTRSPEPTKPDATLLAGSQASPSAPASRNNDPPRSEEPKRATPKPPSAATPAPPPPAHSSSSTGLGGPRETGLMEDLQPLISETRPARKEPDYRQVPASMKNNIPKIALSFLIYSDKPADRRVTINGKVLREGDEVSEGLKLESITHEGAVLSYKGFRFHKGVF